jgi:hypothetical protein
MNDRFPLLSTNVQLAPLIFFSVTTRMPWSVPVVIMAQLDTVQLANAAKLMHFAFDKTSVSLSHTKLCTVRLILDETNNRQALRVLTIVNFRWNNMQNTGASLVWAASSASLERLIGVAPGHMAKTLRSYFQKRRKPAKTVISIP